MGSKLKNLMKDTAWFAIGNFGSKIVAFLLLPLYTNILSTEEYGTIDLITTTISILVPVFTLAFQDGAFRYALDCNEDKKGVFSGTVLVSFLSTIIVVILLPVLCFFLPAFKEYKIFFCLLYLFTACNGVISYYAKGIGENRLFAINGILASISLSVFNIVFLVVFKFGIQGYLISMVLSGTISTLFFFWIGKFGRYFSFSKIDKEQLKRIAKYSMPLIPATIAWLVMISIDKYMLLYMEGVEANGLYSAAHKIPSLSSTVMALFISAWQISAVKSKDDKDSDKFTSSVFNALYVAGYFLTFAVVILSEPIARLLFAKDFYSAWVLTPCLTVATALSVYSNFIGGIFTAHKRSDLHLKSNVLALVVNIVLNYILIKIMGFRGVSIATMISFFLVFVYRNIKVKPLANIEYNRIKVYAGLLILMISGCFSTIGYSNYYILGIIGFLIAFFIYLREIKDIYTKLISVVFRKKRRTQ